MKKGEPVGNHTLRKQRTYAIWEDIKKDFLTNGTPPPEIATKYTNPTTKRPYTTRHIYWILRKMGVSIHESTLSA